MSKLYFQEYKGIYYAFQKGGFLKHDLWVLSDTPDGSRNVIRYNADLKGHRLDQCIELFKESQGFLKSVSEILGNTFFSGYNQKIGTSGKAIMPPTLYGSPSKAFSGGTSGKDRSHLYGTSGKDFTRPKHKKLKPKLKKKKQSGKK